MGFFDGFFGGSQTQNKPASGYYTMPQGYRNMYEGLLQSMQNTFYPPGGNINSEMFNPMGETADETRAFDMARQGLAPTTESLNRDLSMLMNPFDDYVIGDINRQSQGQNSLVNQAAAMAGQQGSNRSFLGSSDVEQNRLNNIGQFRQGQYNRSIDNILGPLAGLRQQDIGNLMGIGEFQRGLDLQKRQAPYSAVQAGMGILNGIPREFGNFGSQASTIKSGGGISGFLNSPFMNLATRAAGAYAGGGMGGGGGLGSQGFGWSGDTFYSDRRLKENITPVGEENGFNIYKFNYLNDARQFIGVMADEVEAINPDAVQDVDGYKAVNYDMIGVNFREVE